MRQLARNMAGRPDALLQKLVDIALELCRAGTAGVSLLQKTADGRQMFVWVALAGAYSGHVGKRTPARFSVCGICLERQAAQLYSHPDRYFSYYASQEDFEAGDSAQPFEDPGIVETLVVPFPAGSRPLGTIWVASHDTTSRFDNEDVRVLSALADFTSAALRVASVAPDPSRTTPPDGVVSSRNWPASKAHVALELEVMNRLHDFSTRLLGTKNLAATLDEVLHAAIVMLGADRGDVQLFDAERGTLNLAAQQGFEAEFLERIKEISLQCDSISARVMVRGERVLLEDIREDLGYRSQLEACEVAGFLAVQSTPLISRDGRALGVLSTHFRQPCRPSDRELRMLDLYARHAADHIDMLQNQQDAREAAERERELLNQARQRTQQLQCLTEASSAIASLSTVEEVLRATTERAREIVPAYQAATSLVGSSNSAGELQAASFKDADWRGAEVPSIGDGLDALVLQSNRALRLTGAELAVHPAAHPNYLNYGEPGQRPPLRGWLAVPLIGRDGHNLGLIQLSDRHVDEFSQSDEAMLVQLAQLASGALENARLYEALREADRRKDEFLAMLSHELRNPLAPLLTALELIGDDSNSGAVRREALSVTRRQVLHLSRLVDDLLEMSRITTGKIRLHETIVDGNTLVERAVERMQPLIDQKQQDLRVSLADEPVWLEVDPARLEQVLGNLLDNASKYTPDGGRIWVTVSAEPECIAFAVRDDGSGIDPDLRPRIFDLFTQADKSLDRSEGGLGIGLALAQQIVGMSGGTIGVTSEGNGRGSEFTVRLPSTAPIDTAENCAAILVPSACATRSACTIPSAYATRNACATFDNVEVELRPVANGTLRVLVVDDGYDAAQMLAMLLSSWRHVVEVAHDGPEALERALSFSPDVILLDIGLPLMDGYEVARRLRSDPRFAGVQLIAITGYGQAADRQRSRAAGFDLHLVKPIDTEELAELLTQQHAC